MTRWTFVIAYYNEADFLGTTLATLAAQSVPFRLVLVDNGSTDGSDAIARAFTAPGIEVVNLSEARPGKIHALEAAMGELTTEFCAFGDADTWYPPHYLAEAERAFDADPGTVAVMALGVDASGQKLRRAIYAGIVTKLLSKQTHTGGYGQAFRTAAFRSGCGPMSCLTMRSCSGSRSGGVSSIPLISGRNLRRVGQTGGGCAGRWASGFCTTRRRSRRRTGSSTAS